MTPEKPTQAQKRKFVTLRLRKARADGQLAKIAADLRIPEYRLHDFSKFGSSSPDMQTVMNNATLRKLYDYFQKRGTDQC